MSNEVTEARIVLALEALMRVSQSVRCHPFDSDWPLEVRVPCTEEEAQAMSIFTHVLACCPNLVAKVDNGKLAIRGLSHHEEEKAAVQPVRVELEGVKYSWTPQEASAAVRKIVMAVDAIKVKCPTCRCRIVPGETCWCCADGCSSEI